MSTSNFRYENILIPVFMEDEDRDWDFDLECMADSLEDQIKDFVKDVRAHDYDRSYSATRLGYVEINSKDGRNFATIYITVNSGYYVGACLDYTIEEGSDEFKGTKTLLLARDRKCEEIERALRTHGKEYIRVATFSNGESIYQPKKSFV